MNFNLHANHLDYYSFILFKGHRSSSSRGHHCHFQSHQCFSKRQLNNRKSETREHNINSSLLHWVHKTDYSIIPYEYATTDPSGALDYRVGRTASVQNPTILLTKVILTSRDSPFILQPSLPSGVFAPATPLTVFGVVERTTGAKSTKQPLESLVSAGTPRNPTNTRSSPKPTSASESRGAWICPENL